MNEKQYLRGLLRDLFEEEALIIGGLVATLGVNDEFVWRLMKNLDGLRERIFARVEQLGIRHTAASAPKTSPHPAIETFLDRLSHTGCGEPPPEVPAREP